MSIESKVNVISSNAISLLLASSGVIRWFTGKALRNRQLHTGARSSSSRVIVMLRSTFEPRLLACVLGSVVTAAVGDLIDDRIGEVDATERCTNVGRIEDSHVDEKVRSLVGMVAKRCHPAIMTARAVLAFPPAWHDRVHTKWRRRS
jgi:hypothetical protein